MTPMRYTVVVVRRMPPPPFLPLMAMPRDKAAIVQLAMVVGQMAWGGAPDGVWLPVHAATVEVVPEGHKP